MVLPILAAKAAGKGSESAQAIKNDLYVRRWATVTGKGKHKKVVDHELHINPVGVALGIAGTAVAAGLTVLGGALALRLSGKKLKLGEATRYFMVDEFGATSHTETYLISPATAAVPGYYKTESVAVCTWTLIDPERPRDQRVDIVKYDVHVAQAPYPAPEGQYWTHTDSFRSYQVWVPEVPAQEAVYGERLVWDSPLVTSLLTKRGVPIAAFKGEDNTDAMVAAVNRATKRVPKYIPGTVENIRAHAITAINPVTRKSQAAMRWVYKYKVVGMSLEDKEDESWISKMFGV